MILFLNYFFDLFRFNFFLVVCKVLVDCYSGKKVLSVVSGLMVEFFDG